MKFIKNWYILIVAMIILFVAEIFNIKEITSHGISILCLSLLLKVGIKNIDREGNLKFIQVLNPIITIKLCDFIIQRKAQIKLNNENFDEYDINNFFQKYTSVKFIFGRKELSYEKNESNIYKKMLEDLNKEIDIEKEYNLFIKTNNHLYIKNYNYLEKLNDEELKSLFIYMTKKIKDIEITYENDYHWDSNLNHYYNDFFSKYKKIVIDKYNIIEKVKMEESYGYENVTLIASNGYDIYVKNQSINNGIYDSDIYTQEDVDLEKNKLTIYHYLNDSIGTEYMIDMEQEYNNLNRV